MNVLKILRKISKKILFKKKENSFFWIVFIFLFFLWLANVSQYLIIFLFLLFLVFLSIYLRNLNLSLLIGSLMASPIQTGKVYEFLLLPPGTISIDRFPEGYFIFLTVTINHILSGIMIASVLNGIVAGKFRTIKIHVLDIFVFGYFIWVWMSSVFASSMPEISMAMVLLSYSILIKYVFFRLNSQTVFKFKNILLSTLFAVLLFEGSIALIQFVNFGPTAHSIEAQKHIEVFGQGASDETDFSFRPLGTFSHANYLAGFIAVVSPILFATSFGRSRGIFNWTYFLSIIIGILTLSRGGWLALTTQMFVFRMALVDRVWKYIKEIPFYIKFIAILSISLIIFTVVFPRLAGSLDINSSDINNGLGVRVKQAEIALALISRNPIFGVGMGMDVFEGYNMEPSGIMWSFPNSIHNIFLLIATESGIPALILFLSIFVCLIYNLLERMRKVVESRNLLYKALLSGIVSFFIIGLLQPYNFLEVILLLSMIIMSDNKKYGFS